MTQIKIKSFAKINLALNVTGKDSSLHKIESIIAFVSLYDEIDIKKIKSKSHKISFTGEFAQNIRKNNTVSKLLQILESKNLLQNRKFRIKIKKRIPSKAGLGGGSMNAASILNYFVKRNIIKSNKKEIINISNEIGSDVILGLNRKNSILNSKKKIKYFANREVLHTLIVKPNFGCSTKEIYSKVRKFNKPKLNNPSIKMFNYEFLKKMSNSLEPIAFSKYPKLKSLKFFLQNFSNPLFVRMTGSGSALVAYFHSKQRCDYAKKQFKKKFKNYWCITSKTI